MPYGDIRTEVRIECLERDHGISLSDLFCNAERHYFQTMQRGVVMPQHMQSQAQDQQQARLPPVTRLNFWYKLPADVGFLVERFMQCRPGTGYGIHPDAPQMVEYVAAYQAFTESLEDLGVRHLKVV
jgi:hypothetical protein